MSVRPWFHPLDRNDVRELADTHTARALDLPREQHALMSGYGGPGQGRSCYITSPGGTVSTTMSYRVPPGVTEVDLDVWVSCDGAGATVTVTSSADAVGTKFQIVARDETDIAGVVRCQTGGPMDAGYGAHSGRALTVRTSAVWAWSDVDVTVDLWADSVAFIYFIAFRPVHAFR